MVTTCGARAVTRACLATHQASASITGTPSASASNPSASASYSTSSSPAVPDQVVCTHTVSCLCRFNFHPTDPSVYFNTRRNRSNKITGKYLLDNLGLEFGELKFLLGCSMAFGCGLHSLLVRVDRFDTRFCIQYSDPDVVGSQLEEILGRLRKEFIILSSPAITEHGLQDQFSRTDDGEDLFGRPLTLT